MKKISDFSTKAYRIVENIPSGRVATYGQIALLLGVPQCSRQVGQAMRNAPPYLPCHRVVNHIGRVAPGWPEQRRLLEAEGVVFKENGNVDLKHFIWRVSQQEIAALL